MYTPPQPFISFILVSDDASEKLSPCRIASTWCLILGPTWVMPSLTVSKMCGTTHISGSRLMVTYKTHESSPDHKGFKAQYEAVCGGKPWRFFGVENQDLNSFLFWPYISSEHWKKEEKNSARGQFLAGLAFWIILTLYIYGQNCKIPVVKHMIKFNYFVKLTVIQRFPLKSSGSQSLESRSQKKHSPT